MHILQHTAIATLKLLPHLPCTQMQSMPCPSCGCCKSTQKLQSNTTITINTNAKEGEPLGAPAAGYKAAFAGSWAFAVLLQDLVALELETQSRAAFAAVYALLLVVALPFEVHVTQGAGLWLVGVGLLAPPAAGGQRGWLLGWGSHTMQGRLPPCSSGVEHSKLPPARFTCARAANAAL